MTQTRAMSFIETCVNTGAGFFISLAAQHVLFPLAGCRLSHAEHLGFSAAFTALSVARGYVLRRVFNGRG